MCSCKLNVLILNYLQGESTLLTFSQRSVASYKDSISVSLFNIIVLAHHKSNKVSWHDRRSLESETIQITASLNANRINQRLQKNNKIKSNFLYRMGKKLPCLRAPSCPYRQWWSHRMWPSKRARPSRESNDEHRPPRIEWSRHSAPRQTDERTCTCKSPWAYHSENQWSQYASGQYRVPKYQRT